MPQGVKVQVLSPPPDLYMFKRRSLVEKMTVDGHFIFKSGKHATTKLDYERLKRRDQRRAAKQIGALIAEEFPNLDAVVGVANGANRLAEDSAKHVSKLLGRNVLAFTTIKDERTGDFTVKKGNI